MGRYLSWATIPGMLLGAALQEWLGGVGIIVAFVCILVGWLVWIRLNNND